MIRHKRYLLLILAVILWAFFIFNRSMQPSDRSNLESQWVLHLIRMLLPVEPSMYLVRKAAHFVEYAILGLLACLLFGRWFARGWQIFGLSLAISAAIAACDETLQLFIPGREGRVQDVLLDTVGSLCGILVVILIKILHSKVKDRPKSS